MPAQRERAIRDYGPENLGPGDVIAVGSEIIRLEVEGKGNVTDAAASAAGTNGPW